MDYTPGDVLQPDPEFPFEDWQATINGPDGECCAVIFGNSRPHVERLRDEMLRGLNG